MSILSATTQIRFFFPISNDILYPTVSRKLPRSHTRCSSDLPLSLLKMDEYCNKIMRLLSIERLSNYEMQKIYNYWIFDKPLNFQTKVFSLLISIGIIKTADSKYLAVKFYAPIYLFAQQWLFCGTLTDEHKQFFRGNAYEHINNFFKEMEGI